MKLLINIRGSRSTLPNLAILVDTDVDIDALMQQLAMLNMEKSELSTNTTCLKYLDLEINRVESDLCFIRENLHRWELNHGIFRGDLLQ